VATRNVISNDPSPNLRKTLSAIPIFLAPVTHNLACPICSVEAVVSTDYLQHGFQRKSTKAERHTSNALAVAADTTKCTFESNTTS